VNVRTFSFVVVFAALLIAPRIVEPAYNLFLVAFAFLVAMQSEWQGIPLRISVPLSIRTLVAVVITVTFLFVTWTHSPHSRDVLRDIGAMFAFFVGRSLFVAYREKDLQYEALEAVSIMGAMVSLYTIGAAIAAYLAGASAYYWRGVYVPWGHSWLPYALVVNVALITVAPHLARRWCWCAALSVMATVASLSRTDLLLDICFGLSILWTNRRQIVLRLAGLLRFAGVAAVIALSVPFLLQLDVVQQRLTRGVGEGDQSLGWRFMENIALYDHFMRGTLSELLFGFGLGARMPLPPGILDFNNNDSIPTLHNSFGTIALKAGLLGLAVLFWYLWRVTRRSFEYRDPEAAPYRCAGRWIVLLCMGKAMTLHGLTEWSHVVFFGIGCMLMLNHKGSARDVAAPVTVPTTVLPASMTP
jgi:hypothetical protein